MNIKFAHTKLIVWTVILSGLYGAWALVSALQGGGTVMWVMGIGALLQGVGVLVYGLGFMKKVKDMPWL